MNNFTENRTVKSLMLASILALGINTAYANDLAPVPKVAEEHPQGTLDKLAGQQIPDTDPVQYYPADGSAYTLTKVQEGGDKPAGDNIITKFIYNDETHSLSPVYYQLDLKQTTFGEGDSSKYYGWEKNTDTGNLEFKQDPTTPVGQTITYSYSEDSFTQKIEGQTINNPTVTNPSNTDRNTYIFNSGAGLNNPEGRTDSIDNVLYIGNKVTGTLESTTSSYKYAQVLGGAVYNAGELTSVTGLFINNSVEANSTGSYSDRAYNYAYGGALYNSGTIGDIAADFIANYAFSTEASALGGAIDNYRGTIGDITGDFIGNYVTANSSAYGGAICNRGTIENIVGDFIGNYISAPALYGGAIYNSGTIENIVGDFIGNYISGINPYGGAINNNEKGTIGNITGDFIGNYVYTINGYSLGGAIYNSDNAEIGNITGDFIGNYVRTDFGNAKGGAIDNSAGYKYTATIGDITGDFIGNYASGYSSANGGAIYNYYNAEIGNITGDFIGNYAYSSWFSANGGAIDNSGTIGDITGDFIGNYAQSSYSATGGAIYNSSGTIGDITGDFIGNYAQSNSSYALGGAINNKIPYSDETVTIGLTNNNFLNNYAISQTGTDMAKGGAIFTNYDLTLNADNGISLISGNYTESNGVKDQNAIYVANYANSSGTIRRNTTFTLNAINNGKIQIDDTISGGSYYSSSNKFWETSDHAYNLALTGDGTGTVSLYNDIENANVTANDVTVDFANNEARDYNFVSMTANDTKLNIDVNLTDKTADTISTLNQSTGTLIVNSINTIGSTDDAVKIQIIKNTDTSSDLQLKLGDNFHIVDDILDTVTDSVFNNDIYMQEDGINVATTNTINDSLIIYKDKIYDTLDVITTKESENERNFTFRTTDNYIASKDLGTTTKGTLNINGLGKSTPSTIDANNHTMFDLQNETTLNISNTTIKNAKDFAIKAENANSVVNLTNASFKDTKGTAIQSNVDVNITADGAKSEFSGNTQAIQMNNADKTITMNSVNSGEIVLSDIIDGTQGYSIKLDGDNKSKITLNNNINNANISLDNTNLYLSKENLLDNSQALTLNSGSMYLNNDVIGTMHLPALNLAGTTNLSVDVDLANETMDRITADNYNVITDAILNVNQLNLISTTSKESVKILFADEPLAGNVLYNGESPLSYKGTNTAYSPIYKYNVSYGVDAEDKLGYFFFDRGGSSTSGNASEGYNPSVLSSPVAAQAGAYAAQNATFNYAFQHADTFMPLPAAERFALRNANKYAITGYDKLDAVDNEFRNKAIWVRPYTSFENIPLKNGPKVDTITYGTLIGGDSDFKELRNGWGTIFTGYIGYNGSSQSYSGVNTYQNGGLVGATQTFYKGNFFTALTASAGATAGESHNMYGHENFSSLMAGVANKSGYNIEFKEGKFIIQPTLMLAYSFINTFDYTNSAGVKINSDPLHAIQINPNVKFIGNLKNGWQPYASVGMVWNILDETNVTANNVRLPDMSIKPFVEYGVGVQKRWKDRCTGYLQAMIRNGGRNGIVLTGGFRWAIGKEGKPIEKVSNPQNKTAQASNNDRKILKQLSPAQRTALGAKPQNTTRTSCIGEVK